jgi:Amt family ammonium transporter
MQAGFAMLEAGSVRYKNYQSSLIKNTVIPIICGLAWFMWGYAFSFGGVNSGFIGSRFFAITDKNDFDELSHWFYQYTVMCCTVNIISGPVAERMNLPTFFVFAFFVAAWIYPVIVAWTWGGGWLAAMGYSDFAGSGIVHLTGGISGLVGAIILGPRLGKEKKINQVEEAKNSIDSAIGEAGIENYESVT